MPPDRRHRDDSRRDAALLLDMLLAADDAQGFVAGMDQAAFLASALHQSAVMRQITIIGEAANPIVKDATTFKPAAWAWLKNYYKTQHNVTIK